jgi:hypothetical protein
MLKLPWVGFLAFALIWLWKPIAHTIAVLMYGIKEPAALAAINLGIGALGFGPVWRDLKASELPATWLGFLGGALIWIGWFEYSFAHFASLIVVALVLFFASNKDTGCRFFLWMHRNLGLRPDSSTPGYQRQFARIAAMELVMTNWFCYIVILTLYDPRIAGQYDPITYAGAAVIAALSFYIIAFKLREQRSIAPALRYGIGSVAVFWLLCEMAAGWGWYEEVWIRPFEYPITGTMIVLAFIAGIVFTLRSARSSEMQT